MGKRSNFERVERDFYPTPYKAVEPLVQHLPKKQFAFAEPCAGDGSAKVKCFGRCGNRGSTASIGVG